MWISASDQVPKTLLWRHPKFKIKDDKIGAKNMSNASSSKARLTDQGAVDRHL
jgi:hypothetical protein